MKLAAIFAKRQVKVGMDSRPRQRKQNVAGERGCGRRPALANVSNEELFPKGLASSLAHHLFFLACGRSRERSLLKGPRLLLFSCVNKGQNRSLNVEGRNVDYVRHFEKVLPGMFYVCEITDYAAASTQSPPKRLDLGCVIPHPVVAFGRGGNIT